MNTIPGGKERVQDLARQDNLTLADIIELTGLAPSNASKLGLAEPCTPEELVALWQGDPSAFLLPIAFRVSVRLKQAEVRDVQWRDELIRGLRTRGLAGTQVDFHLLQMLTTFEVSSHCPDGYQLREDEFGKVIGLEPGKSYSLKDSFLEKEEERVLSSIGLSRRLSFSTTAEQVVRWVWAQGGDVELMAADLDELAMQLQTLAGIPDAKAPAARAVAPAAQTGAPMSASEQKYFDDRRKGGLARKARDPKQAAKSKVLELWKDWQAGRHPKLRTREQFAIEVMRRWPVLKSPRVICGWSAQWSKAVKHGEPPAC